MRPTGILLSAVFTAALFIGCSELKDENPPATQPRVNAHPAGFADPKSADFHGFAVRALKWDMSQCQQCHGLKFDGGIAERSCNTSGCHSKPGGPLNCTTCHGGTSVAPPPDVNGNTTRSARGVGAHVMHTVPNTKANVFSCGECHSVKGGVYDPGHLDSDPPAEVNFEGNIAFTATNVPGTSSYTASMPTTVPTPMYDSQSLSCSGTYCHGNFKNGNPTFAPVWTDTTGTSGACGTCHGNVNESDPARKALPKIASLGGTHPDNTNCSNCHGTFDASKHVNGKLTLFGSEISY